MLEQYDKSRAADILDMILGAVDAHIYHNVKNNHLPQTIPLKGGAASMQSPFESGAIDKTLAQKVVEEGIIKHQLMMQYVDVAYAPSFVDQKPTLTFYFRADHRLELGPLCKDLGSVYNQRIQLKQTGRMTPIPQADSHEATV